MHDSLAERLERGEIITFTPCPFALPTDGDRDFLLAQQLRRSVHKNISYDPNTAKLAGHRISSNAQEVHLRTLLRDFSGNAVSWLAKILPRYAAQAQPDRVSYRPDEEATRKLRLNARNDLLHLDAFPSRPSGGSRLLRLYVNLNATDERVWITSERFACLLERFGRELGLPRLEPDPWPSRFAQGVRRWVQPGQPERTDYDRFMLRLHHFLKSNDTFQERAPRQFWHFAPGMAWLVFTDAVTHAELRGQYALEHSFFIPPAALALPEEAPSAQLARACGISLLHAA